MDTIQTLLHCAQGLDRRYRLATPQEAQTAPRTALCLFAVRRGGPTILLYLLDPHPQDGPPCGCVDVQGLPPAERLATLTVNGPQLPLFQQGGPYAR